MRAMDSLHRLGRALDIICDGEDDTVQVEVQERWGDLATLYIHINGITLCRVRMDKKQLQIAVPMNTKVSVK